MEIDPEMQNERPLVSVMVLNYNGMRFLKTLFDSLSAAEYPNQELILIDNNSTDESVRFIAEHYPQVRIVQTHANAGFSHGYNIGFRNARGKYQVLLNNDVIVEPDWLDHLVDAAEKDEMIAALQPKIVSMIQRDHFEYAGAGGGYIDRYGYPFLRGRIFYTMERDEGQYDEPAEVFWTSGAAMFVRTAHLMQTRLLDELFEYHMEEIDLCWQLHHLGYKLMVIPGARIYHFAGGTMAEGTFRKLYYNHRNNLMMMIKNMETGQLIRILPGRYFLDLVNVFYSALIRRNLKHTLAIIRAHGWILMHFSVILKNRRLVQAARKVPEAAFAHLVYQGSIVLQYFLLGKKTFGSLNFITDRKV